MGEPGPTGRVPVGERPPSVEVPYSLQHAAGRAVSGLLSLREARTHEGVFVSLSGIEGPLVRLGLGHVGDSPGRLTVEPVLWKLSWHKYGAAEGGDRFEEVDRFDPVPLDDLDLAWRPYSEHVRLMALDAVPQLVDHNEFGPWFRDGLAAVDSGWASTRD